MIIGNTWHRAGTGMAGCGLPTSYQYIKGLEAYGYNTVAFEESVRHIQALSDVYQAGFKADYVPMGHLVGNLFIRISSSGVYAG